MSYPVGTKGEVMCKEIYGINYKKNLNECFLEKPLLNAPRQKTCNNAKDHQRTKHPARHGEGKQSRK